MSQRGLKLPNMSFENLSKKFDAKRTVAYETEVEKFSALYEGEWIDAFHVFHHGHLIANIADGMFWVSNAGYSSSTTADRLDTILVANTDYAFRVILRQHSTWVAPNGCTGNTKVDKATWAPLTKDGVTFTRTDVFADGSPIGYDIWLREWTE